MSARRRLPAGVGFATPEQRQGRLWLLHWLVALPSNVEPARAAGAEIARLAQATESGDWRLEAIELLKQIQNGHAPPPRRPRLVVVN